MSRPRLRTVAHHIGGALLLAVLQLLDRIDPQREP